MPEELWMEVCNIVQEAGIKIIPKKNKYKKAKWLSEETLQIPEKIRQAKGKGKKNGYTHLKADFQGMQGEIRKFPQQSMQKNRGKQQNGKD